MKHKLFLTLTLALATLALSGCYPVVVEFSITADPPEFSQVGEKITFFHTVTNKGGDTVSIHWLLGNDSVGTDEPDCNRVSSLDPDQTIVCAYVHTVTEEDIRNGEVFYEITLTGDNQNSSPIPCGFVSNNSMVFKTASITLPLTAHASLALEIASAPLDFRGAGEQIAYTFTVLNQGTAEIAGPITVEDGLMQVACPPGPLPPDAQVTCNATYTSTNDDMVAGAILNTASAVAGELRSDPVTHQIQFVALPGLDLAATSDRNWYAEQGDRINFTYTLTNTGNVPLAGPFQINGAPLDNWSCPPTTSLPAGQTLVCSGSYQVAPATYGGHFTQTAQAQGLYGGQPVLSQQVESQIYYSPPLPSAFNCSQFLLQDACNANASFCTWSSDREQCENK